MNKELFYALFFLLSSAPLTALPPPEDQTIPSIDNLQEGDIETHKDEYESIRVRNNEIEVDTSDDSRQRFVETPKHGYGVYPDFENYDR